MPSLPSLEECGKKGRSGKMRKSYDEILIVPVLKLNLEQGQSVESFRKTGKNWRIPELMVQFLKHCSQFHQQCGFDK